MTTATKNADALLVVDMINDFASPSGHLYSPSIAAIIPEVSREVASFIQAGRPVFTIRDCHVPFDPEFKQFPAHGLTKWDQALVAPVAQAVKDNVREVESRIGRIADVFDVPKRKFSAFYGTDLDQLLRDYAPMQIRTVAIVGNCTDICVLYTAADARNRGYDVEIIEDAVATFRDGSWHESAIKMMRENLGCSIVNTCVLVDA